MDVLAGKCGYRYSDHVEDILSVRGADNVIATAQKRDGAVRYADGTLASIPRVVQTWARNPG